MVLLADDFPSQSSTIRAGFNWGKHVRWEPEETHIVCTLSYRISHESSRGFGSLRMSFQPQRLKNHAGLVGCLFEGKPTAGCLCFSTNGNDCLVWWVSTCCWGILIRPWGGTARTRTRNVKKWIPQNPSTCCFRNCDHQVLIKYLQFA